MWLLILALASSQGSGFPTPPLERIGTASYKYLRSWDVAHDGKNLYFCSEPSLISFDPKLFRENWRVSLGRDAFSKCIVSSGGVVYCLIFDRTNRSETAVGFDSTGRKVWSRRMQGESKSLAVDQNVMYAFMQPGSLVALNIQTNKPLWKRQVTDGSGPDGIFVNGNYLFVNVDAITHCLLRDNGKPVWKVEKSYVFNSPICSLSGVAAVSSDESTVGIELASGKKLWTLPMLSCSDFAATFGDLIVIGDDGVVTGVEPKTGRRVWTYEFGPTAQGNIFGLVAGSQLYLRDAKNTAVLNESGNVVWKETIGDSFAAPLWTDGSTLVVEDDDRLMRYRTLQTAVEVSPTEAAKRMVDTFESLDAGEIKKLIALGKPAFEPLLDRFLRGCAAPVEEEDGLQSLGRENIKVLEVLLQVTTPALAARFWEEAIKLSPTHRARGSLIYLLGERGDPGFAVPRLVASYRGTNKEIRLTAEEGNAVIASIASSAHPERTPLLIDVLNDARALGEIREICYQFLPRNGEPAALEAVRAQRPKREVGSFERHMDLPAASKSDRAVTEIVATAKIGTQEWALAKNRIFGDVNDLWILERSPTGWTKPTFLGAYERSKPPLVVFGQTAQQVLKGGWKALVGRIAELRTDADADGFSDLVEARLGLNPKNPDSDGDADFDGVDPCPNAPNRLLTQSEQVIAAALESRLRFDRYRSTIRLIASKGVPPFEVAGGEGPIIWMTPNHPLDKFKGIGMITASLNFPDRKTSYEPIRWSADRHEADIEVGLGFTGYLIKLRKFGEEWFVVESRMSWIS